MIILFEKEYDSESVGDLERDVYEAFVEDFNPIMATLPKDQYNFTTGTFTVRIEWVADETH